MTKKTATNKPTREPSSLGYLSSLAASIKEYLKGGLDEDLMRIWAAQVSPFGLAIHILPPVFQKLYVAATYPKERPPQAQLLTASLCFLALGTLSSMALGLSLAKAKDYVRYKSLRINVISTLCGTSSLFFTASSVVSVVSALSALSLSGLISDETALSR